MAKLGKFSSAVNRLKKLNPISKLQEEIEEIISDECEQYIKQRLETIVAPFETKFQFEVVESNAGGKQRYHTRPIYEEIERTTATGGTVNSWILFNTLDLGSEDAKLVILPDEFSNETFPGSITTRSSNYDRKGIAVIHNSSHEGMEPRRWTAIVTDEFEASRPNTIRNNIGRLVGKYFGE